MVWSLLLIVIIDIDGEEIRRNVTVMTFLLIYYLFSLMHELNITVYLWMKAISSSPYTNKNNNILLKMEGLMLMSY